MSVADIGSITAHMVRVVRAGARRASRTSIAMRCFSTLVAPSTRPGERTEYLELVTATVLRVAPLPGAYRQRSVASLVELFFELVDGIGVNRFIEAGAKEAAASRRAADLPLVGRVVAFEANPHTYRRFARSAHEAGIEYHHLALDRTSGSVSFYVRLTAGGSPQADGQGSLHRRTDYSPGHQQVTVDSVSLDEFFADETDRRSAVWVDVEGAVANVLAGAPEVLATTDVLLVEVEERPLWAPDQWLASDVIRFAATHGLVPIARDAQSDIQYNVLFVRRDLIEDASVVSAYRSWRIGFGAAIRDT